MEKLLRRVAIVTDAQKSSPSDQSPPPHRRYSQIRLHETVERVELERPFVEPTRDGARELGRWYWTELERSTRGLVRGRVTDGGVELVLGRSLALLRFGRPELLADPDGVVCRFPIVGGLLASRPGGSLAIAQRAGQVSQLEIAVSDYQPSLAHRGARLHHGLLYRVLQAPLHRALTRRSLARAARSVR
jgi:hypothetical protein